MRWRANFHFWWCLPCAYRVWWKWCYTTRENILDQRKGSHRISGFFIVYLSSLIWCEKWSHMVVSVWEYQEYSPMWKMLPVELTTFIYQEIPLSTLCILLHQFRVWGDLQIFKTKKTFKHPFLFNPGTVISVFKPVCCVLCFDWNIRHKKFFILKIPGHIVQYIPVWSFLCLIHSISYPGQFSTSLQSQCCTFSLVLFTPSSSHFSPLRHHFHTALLVSKSWIVSCNVPGEMFCSQLSFYVWL